MKKALVLFLSLVLIMNLSLAQETIRKPKKKKLQKNFLREDRPWTFELPVWVPGFRGEFAYGDVSIEGEDGQNPGIPENPIEPPPPTEPPWGNGNIFNRLFSSSSYLKFFFMTRIAYEKDRLLIQGDVFSGAVGNKLNFRYNDKTVVQANIRTALVRLFAGYALLQKNSKSGKLRYELFAYGGLRVHFFELSSDVNDLINTINIDPVWAEPLVGIQNQITLKSWLFVIQFDYGGYLVNSKGSYMINLVTYYHVSNVLSLKAGWTDWDISHKGVFNGEELTAKVHLSGPAIGFSFHF